MQSLCKSIGKSKTWVGDLTHIALLLSSETIDRKKMGRVVHFHPIICISDSPTQAPVVPYVRNSNGASNTFQIISVSVFVPPVCVSNSWPHVQNEITKLQELKYAKVVSYISKLRGRLQLRSVHCKDQKQGTQENCAARKCHFPKLQTILFTNQWAITKFWGLKVYFKHQMFAQDPSLNHFHRKWGIIEPEVE